MASEKQVQDYLVKRLDEIGAYSIRMNMRVARGLPDIISCYKGRFIAVECKSEKADMKRKGVLLQLQTLRELYEKGAVTAVVNKKETVDALIKTLVEINRPQF